MFTAVSHHLPFELHFLIIWELRILIVGVLLVEYLTNFVWYKTVAQQNVKYSNLVKYSLLNHMCEIYSKNISAKNLP